MKTIQEQIAVMQAFADGKQVQFSFRENKWEDIISQPCWNWSENDYRIKPREPRRIFVEEWRNSVPLMAWQAGERPPEKLAQMVEFIEVIKDNQ